jgi:hypothetical protein
MSVARAEDRAPWRHDPSADPGAKTEGGRHDAALSFPFGIGTKAANRPSLFQCALYLISRPWFLHFTLNHHMPPVIGPWFGIDYPSHSHHYTEGFSHSIVQVMIGSAQTSRVSK